MIQYSLILQFSKYIPASTYIWAVSTSNQGIIISVIDLMSRVFTNGLETRSSIPGRVIPKTQKMVLDAALLNTQPYKVRVKWGNPGNRVAPYSTSRCSSYRKGSLLVTLY